MRTALAAVALLVAACGSDAGARPAGSDAGASEGGAARSDAATAVLDCPADAFGFTRVDVGEVELQTACQGDGHPAVLLHGWPEFHGSWVGLAPSFVAAGYRVIAPDQRGFDASDKPEAVDAYHVDHLVDDMARLIERTTDEPVLLVSHDWGGVIAWILAHRRPELVRGLVVMNGPHPDVWVRPDVDPVGATASAGYVPKIADGTIGPEIIAGQLEPFVTAETLAAYQASWAVPGAKLAMSHWYGANVAPDNRLPTGITVEVPTLVLWGMADPFVTPTELDFLPDLVTHLDIARLDGVGHWVQEEAPQEVAAKIAEFAAGL